MWEGGLGAMGWLRKEEGKEKDGSSQLKSSLANSPEEFSKHLHPTTRETCLRCKRESRRGYLPRRTEEEKEKYEMSRRVSSQRSLQIPNFP